MKSRAGLLLFLALLFLPLPAGGQQSEARDEHSDTVDAAGGAPSTDDVDSLDLSQVEQRIIKLTNEFRAREQREPVRPNPELTAAAEYFAGYMARTGRYGHTADGKRPSQRAESHGYKYCLVSENIATQYNSAGFEAEALAKAFTQGWIESPGHRRNMLERSVVDTGVAVARGPGGTYYAVQMFGRPESMQVRFKVSNRSKVQARYRLGDQTFSLPPRVTRTHQRCDTPELRFAFQDRQPDESRPAERGTPDRAIRPADGEHYIVVGDGDGELTVRKQAG